MSTTTQNQLNENSINRIKQLEGVFPQKKSMVLPVLHIIYEQFGYLDKQAIKKAADITDIPDIFFEEAASFYTMFPLKSVGKNLIQVCRNISCSLTGAEELIAYLGEKLGIHVGQTTNDGLFTLVTVECLGSCGTAPVMQINDVYHENLTQAKVDQILAELRKKQ